MQKKHVLLCVAGTTPAIITESLFGLWKKNITKGEVHIITTVEGGRKMHDILLGEPVESGQIARFNEEYNALWRFKPEYIEVIKDSSGEPLSDIRTTEDNLSTANTLFSAVVKFINNDDSILHASLAGGRKTMGYFLGQCMSWFARPCDDLSHVLVSTEYELKKDFYFPARTDVEAHKHIDYAEQPLVKMGSRFKDLLHTDDPLKDGIRYEDAVNLFQRYLRDQSGEADIRLCLAERAIYLDGCRITQTLSPLSMALHLFLCEHANQEAGHPVFNPNKDCYQHRNNLAACLQRCQVAESRQAKGLSALTLPRNRWPEHWQREGDEAFVKLRVKDMSKPLSDLKSTLPDGYSFQVRGEQKRKTSSIYYVQIDPGRLTIN